MINFLWRKKIQVILILILALFLRISFFDFPALTSQESLYGQRGYFLANFGKDELGRTFPLVFNSRFDYELPVTSYITAFGIFLFGKNDLGLRLPFLFMGLLFIYIMYTVANKINPKTAIFVLIVSALSPVLIFLSKIPNQLMASLILISLFFYLLIKNNLNYPAIFIVAVLAFLTSKNFWFILPVFGLYSLYILRPLFNNDLDKKNYRKSTLFITTSLAVFSLLFIIWLFYQHTAIRSFSENNLSIFQSITIQNGINTLRGQGLQAGWPNTISAAFFNKLSFFYVGLFQWLSYFNPAVYFGQFDRFGLYGYISFGAFLKISAIPLIVGLYTIIKNKRKELYLLPIFFLVTFPAIFIFPDKNYELIALTLPFAILLIASGLYFMNNKARAIIIFLFFLEFISGFYIFKNNFLSFELKSSNTVRPGWLKPVFIDAHKFKDGRKVIISENLLKDPLNYALWYMETKDPLDLSFIQDPYRFNIYEYGDFEVITTEKSIYNCNLDEKTVAILDEKDIKKAIRIINSTNTKNYLDYLGNHKATLLLDEVCLN